MLNSSINEVQHASLRRLLWRSSSTTSFEGQTLLENSPAALYALLLCWQHVETEFLHATSITALENTDQRAFPLLAAAELRCNERGKGLTLLGSSPATSYALWEPVNSKGINSQAVNRSGASCSTGAARLSCTRTARSTESLLSPSWVK
jgi:hypothetical protein